MPAAGAPAQPAPDNPPPRQVRADLGIGLDGQTVWDFVLAQNPAVQDELKLNDSQRDRVRDAAMDLRREHDRNRAELLRPPVPNPEARRAALATLTAVGVKLRAEAEAAVTQALDPMQLDRFAQIRLQVEGPLAFRRAQVLTRLGLDEKQTSKLEAIATAARDQMIAATLVVVPAPRDAEEPAGDPTQSKEFRAAVAKARAGAVAVCAGAMQQIAGVLTEAQWKTYQGMLGEPFDVGKLRATAAGPAPGVRP